MSIGLSPLIPMYPVKPDPTDRLQRFGPNHSQLFGKPLISFTEPKAIQQQPAMMPRNEKPLQSAGASGGNLWRDMLKQPTPLAEPHGSPIQSAQRPENPYVAWVAYKPGSFLNVTA